MLYHHLRHIKAADCFFAYRMLIVQLRREMPIDQVMMPIAVPACLRPSTSFSTAQDASTFCEDCMPLNFISGVAAFILHDQCRL